MSGKSEVAVEDLRRFDLFASLGTAELESFATGLHVQSFKPGKFIIREGSDGTDMFIINSGQAKVCRCDKEGKEVTISFCTPGDVVGEIALLTESKRTADVIAVTTTEVWVCSREHFKKHSERYSGLLYQLLIFMANRVKKAGMRITDLALYDVAYRVSRVLYEMSTVTEENGHIIREKPTNHILASMVGASREAVSRALHSLEEDGHIEMDEGRIWLYSLP